MEKIITSADIDLFVTSRDDFLEIISNRFCKDCNKPQKARININYENPMECGCRCESIETLLTTAIALDAEIKKYSNND